MAKEGKYAQVRLPSGEVRKIRIECRATIGEVGNLDHENIKIGKAGKKRHMGIRPTVRGSVTDVKDLLLLGVSLLLVLRLERRRRLQTSSSLRDVTKSNHREVIINEQIT